MVLLSVNGVAGENSDKRPLENGYSSSSVVPLKYKRRRVSAVRDFPPGCGRHAPLTNLRSDEETVVVRNEENLVVDDKIAADGTNSEVRVVSQSSEISGSLAMVADGAVVLSAGGLDSEGVELPKGLEDGAQELPKERDGAGKSVDVTENNTVLDIRASGAGLFSEGVAKPSSLPNGVEETVPKIRFSRRRVSAARDFPPFCGRNAPCPTEEQRLMVVSKNKSPDAMDKASVEVTPLSCRRGNAVEEGGGSTRETVSVNVEESVKEVEDGNVERNELKAIVPEPDKKSQPVIDRDNEDLKSPVRRVAKEIIIYSRDKSTKRSPSDDPIGMDSEIVQVNVEESEKEVQDGNAQRNNESKGILPEPGKKTKTVTKKDNEDARSSVGKLGKEIVIYSHDRNLKRSPSDNSSVGLECEEDRVVVQGLMAAPNCPWRQGRGGLVTSKVGSNSGGKVKQHGLTVQKMSKPVAKKSNGGNHSKGKSLKRKPLSSGMEAYRGTFDLVIRDEDNSVAHGEEQPENSAAVPIRQEFGVSLPPFGPNSSSHGGDARNKVRETLRLFQAICRKLLQGEEAKLRRGEGEKSKQQDKLKRIDLTAAKIVREKGKEVNTEKQIVGAVPGVEVGDEFQYRVELALVGVHRLYQAGIDYMKQDKGIIATSIVASGGYADDLDSADVLIYSGQGGLVGKDKHAEDQKLERGNLAMKNSISAENPVRVVRGSKETKASDSDARTKIAITYTYDGLYTVKRYWQEPGPHGKLVFKFELRRNVGQPELAWKEVKKSKKFKVREGLCVDDISGGKEFFPICAVNTIDDEKPPPFTYITRIIYPDWYQPTPIQVCDCTGGCSDSQKCSCVVKNGGEIPYNHNGAIVEVKPLVYECGPSCKCPPSCYNRVTQHGIRVQLEIFKTESRGWGVRSLTSIPSGTFICEYVGELLEDTEAEKRCNDEYLFDIGQNYDDCSLTDGTQTVKLDTHPSSSAIVEDSGFTIDAAEHGNVGRFINHSCSPNLYAQNVLYDHDDKRMPHIMFFAAENIPPLKELTYHYNYSIDQIRDSNGNIKMKSCYCGSTECTGRMY